MNARLPVENSDTVNLVCALLVRYPEIASIRSTPGEGTIRFTFAIGQRMDELTHPAGSPPRPLGPDRPRFSLRSVQGLLDGMPELFRNDSLDLLAGSSIGGTTVRQDRFPVRGHG